MELEEAQHRRCVGAVAQGQERCARVPGGVYSLCDRAQHKKVHGAITSASEVLQQARLAQGAALKMASLMHRALAATPAEQRPALQAELSCAQLGLSSSQHAMS